MKNNQLLVLLTALMTVSACSSTSKTNTASVDDIKVEEYLTERAIAQATVGGELLVKLIGNAVGSEKQALVKLIESTASAQGITTMKGLQLSAKNVGTAFTEQEAASIVKQMAAKSSLPVFKKASFQTISQEADGVLAKAAEAQKSSANLSSNVNLTDPTLRANVKNIHNGFGKNPEYTKVYIVVKKRTGLDLWTANTCTTYGKLDQTAAKNLLTLGEGQVSVSREVAGMFPAGGEKATQCMIKKGGVQLANNAVQLLHVSETQVVQTIQLMEAPCNLFPKGYAAAAQEAMKANGGHLPAVSQVQCN